MSIAPVYALRSRILIPTTTGLLSVAAWAANVGFTQSRFYSEPGPIAVPIAPKLMRATIRVMDELRMYLRKLGNVA
jgi:hypothetical protein